MDWNCPRLTAEASPFGSAAQNHARQALGCVIQRGQHLETLPDFPGQQVLVLTPRHTKSLPEGFRLPGGLRGQLDLAAAIFRREVGVRVNDAPEAGTKTSSPFLNQQVLPPGETALKEA